MKKIIQGKTYNTDTAVEIFTKYNNLPKSDFNYCLETIYKTKKVTYFLYFDGGAATNYVYTSNNGRTSNPDRGIKVLDHELLEPLLLNLEMVGWEQKERCFSLVLAELERIEEFEFIHS